MIKDKNKSTKTHIIFGVVIALVWLVSTVVVVVLFELLMRYAFPCEKVTDQEFVTTLKSAYSYDETILLIQEKFKANGWKVLHTIDFQEKLSMGGYEIERTAVVEVCAPHHAYNVMKEDDLRRFIAFLPCRVGVYETLNGDIMITYAEVDELGEFFDERLEEIMDTVDDEMEEILEELEYKE